MELHASDRAGAGRGASMGAEAALRGAVVVVEGDVEIDDLPPRELQVDVRIRRSPDRPPRKEIP